MLVLSLANSSNYDRLTQEFNKAKIEYLKAVVNGDEQEEIKNLNTIIKTGKELKVDTSKYEVSLKSLYAKQSNTQAVIQNPKPKTTQTTQSQQSSSKDTIKNIEVLNNDIIIRLDQKAIVSDLSFFQEKGKVHKDIFEVKGNFKDALSTVVQIEGIERIIINQQTPQRLRITIINNQDPKSIYMLSGNNIIIRTNPAKISKTTLKKEEKVGQRTSFLRAKTIVIDPGHGGKDPGAIFGKNQEKTAVLAVGKHLKEYLLSRGYSVYMTRDSDKFLELKERTSFANSKNADIFISIHANAVDIKNASNAKGVETYFLSPARSERAKRLAAIENKQDMKDLDDSSQNALLTILNRSKITSSNKLAIDVQKYMLHEIRKQYKDTVDGGVREGPFYVLVGAQMPSILIEMGYMTHNLEGKRIFDSNYQKKIAFGIANGIDSYFLNNP